jgi:hypothetical protein
LKDFDAGFQQVVRNLVQANKKDLVQIDSVFQKRPGANFYDINTRIFDSLKSSIKNNLLWTLAINDTTSKDQFMFTNIVVFSELAKGIFKYKPGSNLELNIRAACNFLKDTLKRAIFSFEPGVNWVIRNKNNDRSLMELKFNGSYVHNFSSLYKNEQRDKLTLDGTLNIRIMDDMWIPLKIKYDPRDGNFFGLFQVKLNFKGMGGK